MSRIRTLLVLGLALALIASMTLAGCKTDEPAAGPPAEAPDEQPGETPDETTTPPADGDGSQPEPTEPDADDGSTAEEPATPPATLTVSLYWVSAGENALGVQRTIPYTTAVATATMRELLAGPTAAEKTTWPAISTAIPDGSRLLGVTVSGGVAKVDLSQEFASGGGTFSVTARLAQVVYTLEQFPTIDAVEFYIEGARVETFSSEGLILDGPQRLDDYDDLLPIDA
jgi:spore germination protein GerM